MHNKSEDLLHFQDYSEGNGISSPPPAQINVNSPTGSQYSAGERTRGDPLSQLIYDMGNNSAQMLGAMSGGGAAAGGVGGAAAGANSAETTDTSAPKGISFLSIEYYQQFFNVDTYIVLERIVNSMIPKRAGVNYLKSTIGMNPDLYGPFWISVTLIFSIAISGNIASYLQHANETYHWRYNFHLVSYAATCIFLYACIYPLALWGFFKYSLKPAEEDLETESAGYTPTLLSLMCIYGYSLSIYIPVSVLWVIQISLLQWLLVVTAAFLSGTVLVTVLTPALRNSKYSLFLVIGILSAHFLLAAGFKWYFFHMPDSTIVEHVKALPVPLPTLAAALKQTTPALVGPILNEQ